MGAFTFKTLIKFGFGGNNHFAMAALYNSPSARVLANGILSKPFSISNGTRQGCPLSPLIFDLVMEPLAEAIRSHPEIKGVTIDTGQHKISLFADDVILAHSEVERSLPKVTELLELYGSLTYYKVNTSKSLILDFFLAPRLKQRLKTEFPYSWQESHIPYLGIWLPKKLYKLVEDG